VEADLSNLKGYNYPERVPILERLNENKALNILKKLAKDKASGLNKILNRIFKRVVSITLILITKIFQAYIDKGVHLK